MLDGEVVRAQDVEDRAHVLKMFGPSGAVDEDVVEEDEDEAAQEVV